MDTTYAIFNLLFAGVILLVSYLFKKYYPKEINWLFGYRTKRSMASREAWLFANRYASGLMLQYSLICVALQAVLFFVLGARVTYFCAIVLWLVLVSVIVMKTERRLKGSEWSTNVSKDSTDN